MTNYAVKADIDAELKGITFGATTAVTATALDNLITQESAVIDMHVMVRYNLPVVEASALLVLKKICIDLVSYRIRKILQPKEVLPQPDDKATQEIVSSSTFREAMRMLKDLSTGKMSLPGEAQKSTNFINSTAVNEDIPTEFEFGVKQW